MNPILAIDVSKSKSVAAVFMNQNQCSIKPFSFNHTNAELDNLCKLLTTLEDHYHVKPKVVMEATGNYSKPLVAFFQKRGFQTFVLNPLITSHIKSKSVRKVKTDPVDVKRIAHAFYTQNLQPFIPEDDLYNSLRTLTRQYNGFINVQQETLLRLHSHIDLIYPNFRKMFSTIRSKCALKFLATYPDPQMVLSSSIAEIAVALESRNRTYAWQLHKATLIKQTVEESVCTVSVPQSIVAYYVTFITHMQQTLADLRNQMSQLAKRSPHYKLLRSIPGIGEVTAATILSEIGSIERFHSKKQLIAYAGLDPSVFQSGKFTATNNKISKRGSPYLRKALYQSACASVSKQANGYANQNMRIFYENLLASGKPSKVALTACSAKQLRIIFGVLTSKTEFRL
jgi:transposase